MLWSVEALSILSSLFDVSDKELPGGFPQIIQNPGMKVVEKGRNAVLVCEARGDPSPTVTWIKVKSKSSMINNNLYFSQNSK